MSQIARAGGNGTLLANLTCMASMLVWATAFPAVEVLSPHLSPLPLTAMRMVVAVAFLVPFWLWREGWAVLRAADWLKGLWVGGLGFAAGAALLVQAQTMTDAVTVAVITATMPVIGIALECGLDGRRLTRLLILGILLSLAGGVLAYAAKIGGPELGLGLGLGALLALVSVVAFSWGSRLTVKGFASLSALGQTTVTLVGATVCTLTLTLLHFALGGAVPGFAAFGLPEVGALLIYALGSLAASQLLWIHGVRRLGIGIASMHINAAPFYVMAFMMLLGQPWNGWQAAGAVVVGIGVLISQLGPRTATA